MGSLGNGVTTAIVLYQSLLNRAVKAIAAGRNPIQIKRGMDRAIEAIVAELTTISIAVKGDKEITQVASVAANNDRSIGDIIANAIGLTGK